MWYSVVNPRSPGVPNKAVASFNTGEEAVVFADRLEKELGDNWSPFFVVSTPTRPSIGEVVNPDDLTEDERW